MRNWRPGTLASRRPWRTTALRSGTSTQHRAEDHGGVDVEQLAKDGALLECLVQVGADWIRLGNLDMQQCRVLQLEYVASADRYARKADAFSQLVAGLDDGQTVRERWTAEQLEDLVGDTLP